jgi:hypothetical protein
MDGNCSLLIATDRSTIQRLGCLYMYSKSDVMMCGRLVDRTVDKMAQVVNPQVFIMYIVPEQNSRQICLRIAEKFRESFDFIFSSGWSK